MDSLYGFECKQIVDVIEKMSVRCCQSKDVLRRWLWDGRRVCTQRIYGDSLR